MKKENYKPTSEKDEQNPNYIFNLTASDLLVGIAKGELDPILRAKKELANRGIGKTGRWVGFDNAAKEWGILK